MKKQLMKIIIGASVLLFAVTGISFAHDAKARHHKKTYTCYKANQHHRHWPNHHFKPWRHHQDRYICTLDHHHHYYHSKRKGHWKRSLHKHRRPHRDRYIYIEDHHHKKRHHRRVIPKGHVYKVVLDDPSIEFKVIW